MVLSRETYIKKYVGKENKRLTKAYVKRGRIISENQTLIAKYSGLAVLKNGRDTVGITVGSRASNEKCLCKKKTKNSNQTLYKNVSKLFS